MILKISFNLPNSKLYDYFGLANRPLPPVGTRVLAKFGSATRIGIVAEIVESSSLPLIKIQNIDTLLDDGQPFLPADLISVLSQFASSHLLPLNKLLFAALPPLARRSKKNLLADQMPSRTGVALPEKCNLVNLQQRVVDMLAKQAYKFQPFLACGPPGSGKLKIAIAAIANTVVNSRTCLVLVPELNSIRALVAQLTENIPGIICNVMHSDLADGERMRGWKLSASGGCHVLIGTRIAAFTPLPNLGLVCVFNENDALYRSEQGLIYNSRDLAASRALQASCPVLMLSATLSLELRLAARNGRAKLAMLANPSANDKPSVRIIDVSKRRLFGGISNEMENALRLQLQDGGLSVVLVSRRGEGGTLFCPECSTVLRCKTCQQSLSLEDASRCVCRRCGFSQSAPESCPACGGSQLSPLRPGTTRIAEALRARIPEARIMKIENLSDAEQLEEQHNANEVDIVIGTKLILGLDLKPKSCFVSDADTILFSPSFRSAEMLHDTVIKLIAKFDNPSLLIQTRFANHHVFESLSTDSYDSFALAELAERKDAGLPPYRRLCLFRAYGADAAAVAQTAGTALYLAKESMTKKISLMDLVSVPQKKGACTQFLLSCEQRDVLVKAIQTWEKQLETQLKAKSVKWSTELDPLSW